jgi:hypothetical protein
MPSNPTHMANLCYTIGNWTFMLLDNHHYAISRDYSALSHELFDIFRTLKALKEIVLGFTA